MLKGTRVCSLFACLAFNAYGFSFNQILSTCCRFLKDEWQYLNQDDDYSSDLPISEKVWRNLPRRLSGSDIQVSLSTLLVP